MQEQIVKSLKKSMIDKNMTAGKLSKKLGMSRAYVYAVFSSEKKITLEFLIASSNMLGVKPWRVLKEAEECD